MADKRIQDLTSASSVQTNDLFVLEQSGAAKSLTGQILINDLATHLDGHGGISAVNYTPPVAPSLDGTLTFTFADETSASFTVTNGRGIAGITAVKSGLVNTINVSMNDGTTDSFTVEDGNGIVGTEIKYSISDNGTDPSLVQGWNANPVVPTNQYPYGWTRIALTDKLGNTVNAYSVTVKGDDPTVTVGTVNAQPGLNASASVTNSGTANDPVLNFSFELPKGDKGDTGDYIVPVVSYGTSTAAAVEPVTWYNDPSSISYSAGNFVWRKTEYTLEEAQTVQNTVKEIIGYIGQNGSGSGTVTQITFNGGVYTDDGTGNVDMTVDATDVGAIADPTTKSNGQVLTYDSTADEWVAANPSTGNVNTVNNVGVDAGTTNITIYGTAIKMSSTDNTTVKAAIHNAASAIPTNVSDLNNDVPYLSMGLGTNIPANSDLNDYTTPGVFYVASGADAATISNAPRTDAAYRLEVTYINTSSRIRQVVYMLGALSLSFTRCYSAAGWQPWMTLTLRTAETLSVGSADTGISNYGYATYDPNSNTVRVYLSARNTSANIPTTAVLGTIPAGYRPSVDTYLAAFLSIADGTSHAYRGVVKTDGTIHQSLGNTIREVMLVGEYIL